MTRRVAVLGGGIGGLAAALAFARRGADVHLCERAPAFTEVGAGIQITPNGARVLDALGLSEPADRLGLRAEAVEPMDAVSGRRVTRFDLIRATAPYRFFHRADLVDLLAEGCRAAGVTLETGSPVTAVGDGHYEVGEERREADLVVGAEGLHSLARGALNGGDRARFSGQVAWRAIVPAEEAERPVARIWMAPGRHVVTYPLRDGRLNIVAVQERRRWLAEGWHHEADPQELRAAFAGLAPAVTSRLARVGSVREWGLFLHPVARRWHGERLAILGDAAHPTLPFLAQGANLALEDAWVLAREVTEGQGLAAYQSLRRRRVERALRAARSNASNYHLRAPVRHVAHGVLGMIGTVAPDLYMSRMSWLYDHDVTA